MSDTRTLIAGVINTISTATEPETVTNVMVARVMQYLLEELDKKLEEVGKSNIIDGAVDGEKIEGDSIETTHMADLAITWNKLANDVKTRITSLENSLDALTTDNLSDAIENVQEVLDFLDGIKDNQTLAGLLDVARSSISINVADYEHRGAVLPMGKAYVYNTTPIEYRAFVYGADEEPCIVFGYLRHDATQGHKAFPEYLIAFRIPDGSANNNYVYMGTYRWDNAPEAMKRVFNSAEIMAMPRLTPSSTEVILEPNKFYDFGSVSQLTLTLDEAPSDQYNEYSFQFTSPSTPTTLATIPGVKWYNDDELVPEANMVYQVSIVDSLALYVGREVTE